MSHPLRCGHCHDVIGVYEPLVLVAGAVHRVTSLAKEPAAADPLDAAFHLDCAEATGLRSPGPR